MLTIRQEHSEHIRFIACPRSKKSSIAEGACFEGNRQTHIFSGQKSRHRPQSLQEFISLVALLGMKQSTGLSVTRTSLSALAGMVL